MSCWREHAGHGVDLLNQAQVAANTPPTSLQYLYDAIVAITQAINELEKSRNEK